MTTELEVRHRPLVVGNWEGSLKLESVELGLYEWGLKLAGAPVAPERGLVFAVPLGGRDVQVWSELAARGWPRTVLPALQPKHQQAAAMPAAGRPGDVALVPHETGTRPQVFRFKHFLPEKVEYRVAFKGGPSGSAGFDAATTVCAPVAGPGERERVLRASTHGVWACGMHRRR